MEKYSEYIIRKAKATKLKANFADKTFTVNDKYIIRHNKKTNMWDLCTCKYYTDGKASEHYCSHVLGLLYHLEFNKYRKEIGELE